MTTAETSNQPVLYDVSGPIATITLNRPEKLNAIGPEVIAALRAALEQAAHDDEVKMLVLRGAGSSFSAGYDIGEEINEPPANAWEWHSVLQRDLDLTMTVLDFPKPTIAAVQGWCLGGACELVMACDMVVARDDARFGEPEIRYGSGPVALLMPFVLGQKLTNELLFTGRHLDAEEAHRAGLVNRVVDGEQLDAAVADLAAAIAPTPLAVLRLTKRALRRTQDAMGLRDALQSNLDLSAILNAADTPEQREFDQIAAASGIKAALAWRDQRYR